MRIGLLALTLGFAVYTAEKELHLRRLTRLLTNERLLSTALSNRLREVTVLLDAGKAMNSVLELDAVLGIILRSALQLLDGKGGSIMLAYDTGRLKAACVEGNDYATHAVARLEEGIAGRVAATREPLLLTGKLTPRVQPVESAMSVPLVHRDDLLGVLNINGAEGQPYTEYDLRALSLFAEQAAAAIANARLYEAERDHVAELVELELKKTEFLAGVSHDLRGPITTIVGSTSTLARPDVAPEMRNELAAMVRRQALRLDEMIDELLTTARLEMASPLELVPMGLADLVDDVVADYRLVGTVVLVDVPPALHVMAEKESLRRILANLLENAFKYGAEPVTVSARMEDGWVVLSVLDDGPGVPEDDRERVFERFFRLDSNRGHRTGMGLGLSIVRGLATRLGGAAYAEESPSGGGAFRVRLRRAT
jgi:two-component system sensor histidine kinase KdpD